MTRRRVAVAALTRDAGTQIRARLRPDQVEFLREVYRRGGASREMIPPPDVFDDGTRLVLADGFHRVKAFEDEGVAEIDVLIHAGTAEDAILFSAGANDGQQFGYTNDEKRCAVDAVLRIHPEWSNVRIAEHCHVSELLVRERRTLGDGVPALEISGMQEPDTNSNENEELRAASIRSRLPVTPRKHSVAAPKKKGRDGKMRGSEGQRVAGARRQFENALRKIEEAETMRDADAAHAKGIDALRKMPEDKERSKKLERACRQRRDALLPSSRKRRAPKIVFDTSPDAVKARSQRVRVESVTRACRALCQQLGELLDDVPQEHVGDALRADLEAAADTLRRRLHECVLDRRAPKATVLRAIDGGKS